MLIYEIIHLKMVTTKQGELFLDIILFLNLKITQKQLVPSFFSGIKLINRITLPEFFSVGI